MRIGQEVQALPRRPRQPREAVLTVEAASSACRPLAATASLPIVHQPNSSAVQSQRPRTNSSRAAIARDRRPVVTRAATSAESARRLPDVHGGDLLPGRPDLAGAAVPGDPFATVAEVGVDRGDGPARELGQRSVAAHHLQHGLDEPRRPRLASGTSSAATRSPVTSVSAGRSGFGLQPAGQRIGQGERALGVAATPVTRRPATSGDSRAPGCGWLRWGSVVIAAPPGGSGWVPGKIRFGSGPTAVPVVAIEGAGGGGDVGCFGRRPDQLGCQVPEAVATSYDDRGRPVAARLRPGAACRSATGQVGQTQPVEAGAEDFARPPAAEARGRDRGQAPRRPCSGRRRPGSARRRRTAGGARPAARATRTRVLGRSAGPSTPPPRRPAPTPPASRRPRPPRGASAEAAKASMLAFASICFV